MVRTTNCFKFNLMKTGFNHITLVAATGVVPHIISPEPHPNTGSDTGSIIGRWIIAHPYLVVSSARITLDFLNFSAWSKLSRATPKYLLAQNPKQKTHLPSATHTQVFECAFRFRIHIFFLWNHSLAVAVKVIAPDKSGHRYLTDKKSRVEK